MPHPTRSLERPTASRPAAGWPPAGLTPAHSCVGVITAANVPPGTASEPHTWTIRSGAVQARGRQAASCLLQPRVGDTVACLLVAPDEVWVLAVLQREASETPEADVLSSERPLQIRAPELSLSSPRFSLQADQAEIGVEDGQVVGQRLRVVGSSIKLVGQLLSSVFDRVTHFSQHHLRHTEGTDRVQAAHVECEAQQLLRLSGEHTLINGEKLVKARGGQIHFG